MLRRQVNRAIQLILVSGLCACSLETPKPGKLVIRLEDADRDGAPVAALFSLPGLNATANPNGSSDFNCFAVNVTGPGIAPNSRQLDECTSPTNMRGRGVGVLSELFARGRSIELDVPAGLDRSIDVFGIFPTTYVRECGGVEGGGGTGGSTETAGGYFLGRRVMSLTEGASVTIPISYAANTDPDVVCKDNPNGPSGGTGGGGTGSSFFVSAVFPPSATTAGGTVVKVLGNGFQSGIQVRLGGVTCAVTAVPTPQQLLCTTGGHASGAVTTDVQNPDGSFTGAAVGSFNYVTGPFIYVYDDPLGSQRGDQEGPHNYGTSSGQVIRTFHLRNSGGGTGAFSSISVSGSNFARTGGDCPSSSTTFTSGADCTINVTFDPSSLSAGQQAGASIQVNGTSMRSLTGTKAGGGTGSQLKITGPNSAFTNSCSGAITVQSTDSGGNPVNVSSATAVSLAPGGAGAFFAAAGCSGGSVASVTIPASNSSAVFYFRDSTAEVSNFSVSASGFSGSNFGFATGPSGTPVKLTVSGPTSGSPGACAGPFTVTTKDAGGATTNVASNTLVSFSGRGAGQFHLDNLCTVQSTNANISGGSNNVQFYFKDPSPETLNLGMSASGFLGTGTSFQVQ